MREPVFDHDQHFGHAFEHAAIGMAAVGLDGAFLRANDAFCRLVVRSPNELLALRWTDITHPSDIDESLAVRRRLLTEGLQSVTLEKRYLRTDGTTIWVLLFVDLISDPTSGDPLFFFTQVIDITERKRRKESELRATREQLAEAQEIAHLGSWEWNARADAMRWSDETYRLCGVTPESFPGTFGSALGLMHPDDRHIVVDLPELRTFGPFEFEARIVRPDGSTRWMSWRGRVDGDEDGVERAVGTIQDITERKQVEGTLRHHEERLRLLSRRLVETQELERRNIARDLHDDIGQLLTGAKLTLGRAMLASRSADPALMQAAELIGAAMARVREISLLLRPPMLDDMGLIPAVEWYLGTFRETFGMDVRFEHDGLKGRLDPGVEIAVYRFIQEGLMNVVRHAGVGDATVRVMRAGGHLEAEIEDAGTGFDPDAVSPAASGLTGMRERIDAVGGSLRIESAPGAGTRLAAEIPLAP